MTSFTGTAKVLKPGDGELRSFVEPLGARGAGSVGDGDAAPILLGCSFAAAPSVQSRLMDVAREGQTMAAASMHSAFNIANALGAWLGGLVIAHGLGYAATGYVGALLSAFGLGVFGVSWGLETRGKARAMG